MSELNVQNVKSKTGSSAISITDAGNVELVGGLSVTAVASGAIASGDTVVLNSDGTVSAVTESTAFSQSSPTEYVSTGADMRSAYLPTLGKVVIAYGYYNYPGETISVVVGTVSGTTITFGTPVTLTTSGRYPNVVADDSSNTVLIVYRDDSSPNYTTAVAGGVSSSGNSITFGSAVAVDTAGTGGFGNTAPVYDPNAGKFIVNYEVNISGSRTLRAAVITASADAGTGYDTSLSVGTPVQMGPAGQYSALTGVFNSNTGKVFFSYSYNDFTTVTQYGVAGLVSGTTVTFGSAVAFGSIVEGYAGINPAADIVGTNYVAVTFVDSESNAPRSYGAIIELSSSNNTFQAGTPFLLNDGYSFSPSAIYDQTAGQVLFYVGGSSKGLIGVYGVIEGRNFVQKGSLSRIGSRTDGASAIATGSGGGFVFTREGTLAVGIGQYYSAITFSDSNIIDSPFLGVSSAAYSNGDTVAINPVGSFYEYSSSTLTTGEKYYVSPAGDLQTVAATPEEYAGIAMSSTKLLIKG